MVIRKHEKRLYYVIELNHDQVTAHQKGFDGDAEESSEGIDKEENRSEILPDSKLPF
ncbi:MAG: hypothetical protein LUD46_09225 [Parabacteroides sp.]|nr:hypothetical protein [Parabacteroides sp.]